MRTRGLLDEGAILCRQVKDFRLGLEVAVIAGLARQLTFTLEKHDPLSQKVHHDKLAFLRIGAMSAASAMLQRLVRPAVLPGRVEARKV